MAKENKNILVVDDESKIVEVVSSYLQNKGFRVFPAQNGKEALHVFNSKNIALVLLDLMLPDISGEDICRMIRKTSRVPIIMLTAKSEEKHLIEGLSIGADDYITKPFSLKELHARIEAVLRRTGKDVLPLTVKNTWNGGDLSVDFEKNVICKRGVPVNLTPNELKILATLMKHPGKVYTRGELINAAFGSDFDGYDRAVDSHIKNLRQKIEDIPHSPVYILTVHGFGYKFGGE